MLLCKLLKRLELTFHIGCTFDVQTSATCGILEKLDGWGWGGFDFYKFIQRLPTHFECNLYEQCIKCSNVLIAEEWIHASFLLPLRTSFLL